MPTPATIASSILTRYKLSNVKVSEARKNPYESKIPAAVQMDAELYKSSLGTPVFSDITLGDKINPANNQWTDNNGVVQSFEPMTFYTVLINVSREKKIVRTEIQGRNGTVKEYISDGDADIDIIGMICGDNGVYPIDDVQKLNKIIKAPIPIIVTSWYLQNLDIDQLVIMSDELPQDEGGQSYQHFRISCISDQPVELKIKG